MKIAVDEKNQIKVVSLVDDTVVELMSSKGNTMKFSNQVYVDEGCFCVNMKLSKRHKTNPIKFGAAHACYTNTGRHIITHVNLEDHPIGACVKWCLFSGGCCCCDDEYVEYYNFLTQSLERTGGNHNLTCIEIVQSMEKYVVEYAKGMDADNAPPTFETQ